MDPKELRVGNFLEMGGTFFIVLGIMIDGTLAMDEVRDRPLTARQGRPLWLDKSKGERPSGIPLTADILRAGKFEEWQESFKSAKAGIILQRHSDGLAWLVKTHNGSPLTSLRHLHQLQNLYYAITGEEIPVSL